MPFLTGRKKEGKRLGIENLDEVFFACSHIKEGFETTCDWTEFDADKPGYVYDGSCPKCGGPVVEDESLGLSGITKKVLPPEEQKRVDMEEVRRLAAELKGVAYEPLPIPEAHVPVLSAGINGGGDAPQVVTIKADGKKLLTFTWAPDGKNIDLFLPGKRNPAYTIAVDDDFPNVIKEVEWPSP